MRQHRDIPLLNSEVQYSNEQSLQIRRVICIKHPVHLLVPEDAIVTPEMLPQIGETFHVTGIEVDEGGNVWGTFDGYPYPVALTNNTFEPFLHSGGETWFNREEYEWLRGVCDPDYKK